MCLRIFAYASEMESLAISCRLANLGCSLNDGIDFTAKRVNGICPGRPAIRQGAGLIVAFNIAFVSNFVLDVVPVFTSLTIVPFSSVTGPTRLFRECLDQVR